MEVRNRRDDLLIREANQSDLPELARIHLVAYSTAHFTSLLPHDVLCDYYSQFICSESRASLLISTENGKEAIVGFAVHGEGIPDRLTRFKRHHAGRIFRTALLHPVRSVLKLINAVKSRLKAGPNDEPVDYLLLSIAVVTPGAGHGARLLDHVCADAARRGRETVGLYVNSDNFRAVNAYFGAGFRVRGYRVGQYYMEYCQNQHG